MSTFFTIQSPEPGITIPSKVNIFVESLNKWRMSYNQQDTNYRNETHTSFPNTGKIPHVHATQVLSLLPSTGLNRMLETWGSFLTLELANSSICSAHSSNIKPKMYQALGNRATSKVSMALAIREFAASNSLHLHHLPTAGGLGNGKVDTTSATVLEFNMISHGLLPLGTIFFN